MADYMRYADSLINDLVEQFKDQPNIEALMKVIAGEMQAVFDFYQDLKEERWPRTAMGKQLDGVGDIVDLTRMQAGLLAGDPIPFDVIDDETYRQFLIFKILKNTSDCTYSDILTAFQMFWDRPLYYSEDPEQPATMIWDTGWMQGLVDTTPLFTTPLIRAAGITLKLYARTSTEMERDVIKLRPGLGYAMTSTDLPYLEREIYYGTKGYLHNGYMSIAEDILPEEERDYKLHQKLRLGARYGTIVQDEIDDAEREIDYRCDLPSGSVVNSVMTTPINGLGAFE